MPRWWPSRCVSQTRSHSQTQRLLTPTLQEGEAQRTEVENELQRVKEELNNVQSELRLAQV